MAFKLVYFVQFEWKIIMALAYVQAYILMSTRRTGEQRRASQCSRRVSVGSVTMAAAKCEMRSTPFNRDHYRIIVSYRY